MNSLKLGLIKTTISKKKLMLGNNTPDKVSLLSDIPPNETNDFYEPASEILAKMYTCLERK